MWIEALDLVLNRLKFHGAQLHNLVAVSGSAQVNVLYINITCSYLLYIVIGVTLTELQQHGSLYWSAEGVRILENLDPDMFLHGQLSESAFTIQNTPIWMDGI